MVMRTRKAALLLKQEPVEGTFQAPSASTDGVLVEITGGLPLGLEPQNTETNEVTGSLDGRGPIPGGLQCSISARCYLKGSGVPGVAPEFGDLLKALGFLETEIKTDIVATTISVTGTNTIADSANGLAACTVGTAIYLIDPVNAGNNKELMVTASAAGSLTVTNVDGSAPALTNFAAGPSITIRRGIAAVQATAGAAAQFTAQAPWSNTLQIYRHLPVWLSTNPNPPKLSHISDYSAARVAKLTDIFSPVLDNTTKASIPACMLYTPHSGVIPSLSAEFYMDGVVYRFKGLRGDVTATLNAAGACWIDFTLRGMFHEKVDAAVPTVTYDGTRPGTWRNSRFSIDGAAAALTTLSVRPGNQLAFPNNPNAEEGFDAPQIMSRRQSGDMDPYATTVATRDLMGKFRTGVTQTLHARVLGGSASRAGNRFGIVIPTAFYEGHQPGDNQGMATEQTPFFMQGEDAAGHGHAFY
jgi:hypothetical protein